MTCWTKMLPAARKVSGERIAREGLDRTNDMTLPALEDMPYASYKVCLGAVLAVDEIRIKHFGRIGR